MKIEKQISKYESKLGEVEVKTESKIKKITKNYLVRSLFLILVFSALVWLVMYLNGMQSQVYIENAQISAPVITLSPIASGILDSVFVQVGDKVKKDTIVAKVNGLPIRAKSDGIVVSVNDIPGQVVSSQTAIVKMIDPSTLRVVGRLEENKGLSDVKQWQKVVFTADAFSGKEYSGVVESVAETSRDSDIVFSISDKRQEKEFDITAKFDITAYPELKNGMSAKMTIYK